MEVAFLRTELDELRSRSSRDINDLQQQRIRETEHWEVREASAADDMRKNAFQVKELESRLSEVEIEQVRLQTALSSVEKDEARSLDTLEHLRPELAACEARSAHSEMR